MIYSAQKYNYIEELKSCIRFFKNKFIIVTLLKIFKMKTLFPFFIICLISFSGFSQNKPEFKFEKETIDYGKIALNSNGIRVFTFTNIGNEPLIISRVQSSCGCTIPEKPEKPIMPGEKGEIKVSYNTKKSGGFSKSITIFSNAKTERKVLKIKGFVEKEKLLEKEKSMLSDS